jgi:hypothetical protein
MGFLSFMLFLHCQIKAHQTKESSYEHKKSAWKRKI